MHVSEQQHNFELALVERLKVDPSTCSFEGWDTNGDTGRVHLDHYIPADELNQMWRDAAPPPPPKIADVKKGDTIRFHNGQDGYVDVEVGEVVPAQDGVSFVVTPEAGA